MRRGKKTDHPSRETDRQTDTGPKQPPPQKKNNNHPEN